MKVLLVNARCKHDIPLVFGEDKCELCTWEADLVSKTPPFKVRCIDDRACDLTKDMIYTVRAIVRDGLLEADVKMPCYLLKASAGDLTARGYDVGRFILSD